MNFIIKPLIGSCRVASLKNEYKIFKLIWFGFITFHHNDQWDTSKLPLKTVNSASLSLLFEHTGR